MRAALLLVVLVLGGCPRGSRPGEREPVAEPAPVEINWPDAAVP